MKEKMTIVIMFRNGTELRIKCDQFKHAIRGNSLEKLSWDGCTENFPLWLDINEILCVYRVFSDEQD